MRLAGQDNEEKISELLSQTSFKRVQHMMKRLTSTSTVVKSTKEVDSESNAMATMLLVSVVHELNVQYHELAELTKEASQGLLQMQSELGDRLRFILEAQHSLTCPHHKVEQLWLIASGYAGIVVALTSTNTKRVRVSLSMLEMAAYDEVRVPLGTPIRGCAATRAMVMLCMDVCVMRAPSLRMGMPDLSIVDHASETLKPANRSPKSTLNP